MLQAVISFCYDPVTLDVLFRKIMALRINIRPLSKIYQQLRRCKNFSCFNSRPCFARLALRQQGWSTFCGPYREARHARGIGRVHFRRCGFVGSVLRSSLHGPASPQPDLARTAKVSKFETNTGEGNLSGVWFLDGAIGQILKDSPAHSRGRGNSAFAKPRDFV